MVEQAFLCITSVEYQTSCNTGTSLDSMLAQRTMFSYLQIMSTFVFYPQQKPAPKGVLSFLCTNTDM